MPRWFYAGILAVIVAAVIAGAFTYYTERPASYNECVVREMRGQPAAMMGQVSKVCAIRFHKEEELPIALLQSGKVNVIFLPDFKRDPSASIMGSRDFSEAPMELTVAVNKSDYDITRIQVKYAYKFVVECDTLSENDWTEEQEISLTNGTALITVPTEWSEKDKVHITPQCTAFLKMWGVLRR